MLTFRGRFRYASGFEVDAAFETGPGVTALLGPSGSGKTTILSLIAGILKPERGFIQLAGRVLCDTEAGLCLPPERRGIGFVFQEHRLFPHLSVEANLRYGAKRQRAAARDAPTRTPKPPIDFDHLVEILEIGRLLRRSPQALSGGQRQRVALGRALLCRPSLLLMDEPVAALDEPLRDRVLDYLERVLAEYGVPTLYVSHDRSVVERIAHRTIALAEGHVANAEPGEKGSSVKPLRSRPHTSSNGISATDEHG